MVNKIIADYLKTSKRLVVPQFGAFIRKEDSGTIAFVPFLKKDDGVLTQLLCSAYGLTPNDAQTVINAFVEEVKESVSTRGVYIIEGVGNITTDPNGILRMESEAPQQPAAQPSRVAPAEPKPIEPATAPQTATEPRTSSVTPSASPADSRPVSQTVPPVPSNEPKPTASAPSSSYTTASTRQTPSPAPTQKTVYSQQPTFQQKNSGAPAATTQKPRSTYTQGPDSGPQTTRPQTTSQRPPVSNRPFVGPTSRPAPQQQPARPPYGRTPQGPRRPAKKNKADLFIIIAILAAAIALGVMIFGFLVGRSGPDIDSLIPPAVQVDSTAADSTIMPAE